jgi:hypothetical protein
MLQSAKVQVYVNRQFVDVIRPTCGVFQGSILSPFLFDIFIDDLATALNRITPSLLFADDVNIKAPNAIIAQQAIHVCEQWSSDNSMIWTLPKCGIVGLSPGTTAVLLHGHPIPCVEYYKYLGTPHYSRYISWTNLVSSQAQKYTRFMTAITDYAVSWPYISRTIIWRTFARPILEYCLPITDAWITKNLPSAQHSTAAKRTKATLKACYHAGFKFIFQKELYNYMMPILSGVPDIDTRSKFLRAGFSFHLQSLTLSNPLIHYRSSLSSSSHHVLPSLWTHALVSLFVSSYKQPVSNRLKPQFQRWIRGYRIAEMLSSTKPLALYARSTTTNPIDFSLRLNHPDAINWRLGHLFARSTCPSCSRLFNRRHLRDCDLLLSSPAYTDTLADPHYIYLCDTLSEIFPDHMLTPLDYALNVENEELTVALFSTLRDRLSSL